jgi:predicted RNA binding protein YcfA (HicA-like mRNA interferase family)
VRPALPVVSGQETVTVIEKIGSAQVGQRGSHVKLRDQGGGTVIVPIHRELARGTLPFTNTNMAADDQGHQPPYLAAID